MVDLSQRTLCSRKDGAPLLVMLIALDSFENSRGLPKHEEPICSLSCFCELKDKDIILQKAKELKSSVLQKQLIAAV
jgi:hypothetical protein